MCLDEETRAGIDSQLRLAIQALALPAEEQIRVSEPACVTCELNDNFRNFYEAYHTERSRDWTPEQANALRALADALKAIPDEGFECGNNKSLDHPGWDEVRRLAKEALDAFSWPMETPPPYQEVKPGVWARPGSTGLSCLVFDEDPLEGRLARIARKLEDWKEMNFFARTFGERRRWYRMKPPLPSSQVEEFERKNNVSLPEEYARFITTIGNGGPGPCLGLFQLYVDMSGEGVAEPFPYTAEWNFPVETFERWGREEEQRYNSDEHIFGTLPITTEGCEVMHRLVVTGPEKGNVWCDHRASDSGLFPLACITLEKDEDNGRLYRAADEERISFLDWYEHWLDVELARPRSRVERILGGVRSVARKVLRADTSSRRIHQ